MITDTITLILTESQAVYANSTYEVIGIPN